MQAHQLLLHTLNYAITSFTALSEVQSTAYASLSRAGYAILTKPNDKTVYYMDIATGVVAQLNSLLLSRDIVDTTLYKTTLYYLTKDSRVFGLDLRTGLSTSVISDDRLLLDGDSKAYFIFIYRGRLYVAGAIGVAQMVGSTNYRGTASDAITLLVQKQPAFGDRPDITFTSDEDFTRVLPEAVSARPLTYSMKDLPVGLSFNAETRELTKSKNIQPGVYQVQYIAASQPVYLSDGTQVPGCSATQRFSITVGAPEREGGLCIPGETPACTFAQNTGVHICSLTNTGRQSVTPIGQLPAGVTLRQPQASSTIRRATPILNETGLQAQGFDLTQALSVNDLQLHLISYSDVIDVNTFVPTLQYRLFGCENEAPVSRLYYKREIATGPLARGHNPCGPGFAGGNQVNNPNWTGWRLLQLAYIDPDTETARVFEYNTATETLTELLGDSTFYTQQQVTTRVTPAQLRIDTAVLSLGNHAISVMQNSNTLSADVKITATSAEIDICRRLQAQPTTAQQVPLSILEEGGLLLPAVNLRATTDDQQFNIALPRATRND